MKDFEGMSYDEIRPIFEKIWDFNHNFVPMDLEIDKEKKKPAESQKIEIEQIKNDTTGKRKKSLPRKRTRNVDFLIYKSHKLWIGRLITLSSKTSCITKSLEEWKLKKLQKILREMFIIDRQDVVGGYTGWSKKGIVPQN
ncbi:hypothetical protein Tco_0151627 [Tanacetum coccineum]